MTTELADRIRGCLLGLAVGDALGVPVETMTHEEIMAATNGQGIVGYSKPLQKKVRDTGNLPPGSTSDDTQLTRVTLRSLVQSGGFNLRDQANCLVDEFETTTFGWGGTTRVAAQELKDWRDSGGTRGRAPEIHAPCPPNSNKRGCGSGVAMRIAPLAIHHLLRYELDERDRCKGFSADAMSLGLLTHADPRASIAAIALGHTVSLLTSDYLRDSERTIGLDYFRIMIWNRIIYEVRQAEATYRHFRPEQPLFSSRLKDALSLRFDSVALRQQINTGFSAMQSVPFAIATALRHPNDFRTAVLEGVNAGQDTDTVGSMVGAIVGARVGIKGIPEKWLMDLHGAGSMFHAADSLLYAMRHPPEF